jgi:hypothetical protein
LQLLIEVVIRVDRVLSPVDKERLTEKAAGYLNQTSGQHIYRLEKDTIPRELEQLGELYH